MPTIDDYQLITEGISNTLKIGIGDERNRYYYISTEKDADIDSDITYFYMQAILEFIKGMGCKIYNYSFYSGLIQLDKNWYNKNKSTKVYIYEYNKTYYSGKLIASTNIAGALKQFMIELCSNENDVDKYNNKRKELLLKLLKAAVDYVNNKVKDKSTIDKFFSYDTNPWFKSNFIEKAEPLMVLQYYPSGPNDPSSIYSPLWFGGLIGLIIAEFFRPLFADMGRAEIKEKINSILSAILKKSGMNKQYKIIRCTGFGSYDFSKTDSESIRFTIAPKSFEYDYNGQNTIVNDYQK